MVAINTTDSVQRVFFPLPVQAPAPAADIAVRLVNTVDGNEVTLAVSDWAAEGFLLRAVVQLPAAGFYPGEWEYTFTYIATDGDRYYGLGLVNAREKDPGKAVQYEHEVIYKQYGE